MQADGVALIFKGEVYWTQSTDSKPLPFPLFRWTLFEAEKHLRQSPP